MPSREDAESAQSLYSQRFGVTDWCDIIEDLFVAQGRHLGALSEYNAPEPIYWRRFDIAGPKVMLGGYSLTVNAVIVAARHVT
jgi:hypothetical protein